MQLYRDAIASIESAGSGDYRAIGPTNPRLGRALGRYQIMEANLPQWSREAIGREVTPEEFLGSPAVQDAIFDHRFGGYVERYGPEGAAQAWFAGPGGVGKVGRSDVLGTSVGEYSRKFTNALGRGRRNVAAAPPQDGYGGNALLGNHGAGQPRNALADFAARQQMVNAFRPKLNRLDPQDFMIGGV